MSRIGKNPVPIPAGVEVQLADERLTAKGRLGMLSLALSSEVTAEIADGAVTIRPKSETKQARAMWGTIRALVKNMVAGVSEGFVVSHEIAYPIPAEVRITCERPTAIRVSGPDRQRVGQIAAEIRAFRPPEPYKGKGIRYADEVVRRKEGKKK
jgi:large subunit ribosomal protein L6